jgi:hypothetical protein
MTDSRLPSHLEVASLVRAVNAAGGFATVAARGDRDSGAMLVVCCVNGGPGTAYERTPQRDGSRAWTRIKVQDSDNPREFQEYCERRRQRDPDLWIVELDIPDAERFIESSGTLS